MYFDGSNVLQGGGFFSVTNGALTFNTNGTLSGTLGEDFTGAFSGDSNGIIYTLITNSSGSMPITFYLNAAKDNMAEVDGQFDTNNDQQEIVVGHRMPPSGAASDIKGSWNVLQFQTPVQITGDTMSGLQGGGNFSVTNGTLTFDGTGHFSGKVADAVSGIYNVSSNGIVTLHMTSGDTITLYLNYNKNTMTHVSGLLGPQDNQQEMDICYLMPASVALADLAGTWNLAQFQTPRNRH